MGIHNITPFKAVRCYSVYDDGGYSSYGPEKSASPTPCQFTQYPGTNPEGETQLILTYSALLLMVF